MTEEKIRFQMRIDPDTDRKIKAAMPLANSRSQNEFVERALRFYCSCLTAGDSSATLAPLYLSALQATVQNTENRIARLMEQSSEKKRPRVPMAAIRLPRPSLEWLLVPAILLGLLALWYGGTALWSGLGMYF